MVMRAVLRFGSDATQWDGCIPSRASRVFLWIFEPTCELREHWSSNSKGGKDDVSALSSVNSSMRPRVL